MDRSEVYDRVVNVVCRVLNIDADMVEEDSNFVFDLGAESMESVQLVAGFEEEFDIDMDNEAALKVQTVGEAVDFVQKYVDVN